jgi:dolichyl-phosphate beta-glucosyltransferase
MVAAAPWIFDVLFGGVYAADRTLLALLASGSVCLGCLSVVGQYLVARRHAAVWFVWAGLGAAVLAAGAAHEAPHAIAIAISTAAAATLVVAATAALRHAARDVESPSTGSSAERAPDVISLTGAVAGATSGDRPTRVPQLSVVMPSYNGGERLRPCVDAVIAVLRRSGLSWEVVVVIDGSDDSSPATLEGLPADVHVLRLPTNMGKGAALRAGFSASRGRAVGFIDSDGDIDPTVLLSLHDVVAGGAWAAIASKRHPGAAVHTSLTRRLGSRGYQALARWLFELDVADTQCGCKMFERQALLTVLPHTVERGFAFDVEVLAVGRRLGMSGPVERPALLTSDGRSTLRPRAVASFLVDTFRLWRRLPPPIRPSGGLAAAPVASDTFVSPVLS